MQVNFVERTGGPEQLVIEAELVFDADDPVLGGMKLVGFTIWRGTDGDLYVTFPSRAFGSGQDRRYWDYLRPVDPQGGLNIDTEARGAAARHVKAWILGRYRCQQGGTE